MTAVRFLLDEIVKFGTPWHGRLQGTTLYLPNATTMTAPADSADVYGGDYIKAQVPGQPAAVTSVDEVAEGKEWKNYGIISGLNHLFYGKVLGERTWLYIAPDDSVWLASLTFPTSTADITFKRFGLLGEPPASVAQTISITPGWTTVKSLDLIQDVSLQGDKVIWSHRDAAAPAAGLASRQRQTMVEGITLLTISGTPPSASASWDIEKTEAQCSGSVVNTLTTTQTIVFWYGIEIDGFPGRVDKSTVIEDSVSWNWPTEDSAPTPPALDVPDGYVLCTEPDPAEEYCVTTDHGDQTGVLSGDKSISNAIMGAKFDPLGVAEYVYANVILTDASTYYPNGDFSISRTGSLSLTIESSPVFSIDFIATMSWDNSPGSCTAMRYKVGDLFDDTNAAHYSSYFFRGGGASGIPLLKISDEHIHLEFAAEYGGTYINTWVIPARYANHCYGAIYVEGSYVWTISPTWSETSGGVVENHQAFSADGSSSVTASWSGTTTGTQATQHAYASSNPETNAVAISVTENVCYV